MRTGFHFYFFSYLCALTFFLLAPVSVFALDYASTNFIVRDPVISAGGGYGSSGTFQLFGSQDTVFTGYATATSFIGEYGFLYFPSATPTPTPTPTPSGGGGGVVVEIGVPICGRIADFNCDGYVDLLDFSILLYYFDLPGPVDSYYDLSVDGELNLMDISILFYYWDPRQI